MDHSSNEENPRGVATGEGEVVSKNNSVHGGIVVSSEVTNDDLDEADESEVKSEVEEERDKDGP